MRVALVEAERGNGEINRASGYLIGDRLVLTVRSMVVDPAGGAMRVGVRLASAPRAPLPGQIVWDNAQLGVALVKLTGAVGGTTPERHSQSPPWQPAGPPS